MASLTWFVLSLLPRGLPNGSVICRVTGSLLGRDSRRFRTIRNGKLDTRSARSRLTLRREPYWTVVSEGCAVGDRRGAKGY